MIVHDGVRCSDCDRSIDCQAALNCIGIQPCGIDLFCPLCWLETKLGVRISSLTDDIPPALCSTCLGAITVTDPFVIGIPSAWHNFSINRDCELNLHDGGGTFNIVMVNGRSRMVVRPSGGLRVPPPPKVKDGQLVCRCNRCESIPTW